MFGHHKKTIGGIIGIILAIVIAFLPPPPGLTVDAMRALGVLAWAIVYWIFEVFPEYLVALLMCTFWAALKVAPFKVVFSTFATETWWLLVGTMGLGAAVAKSGLLNRTALMIMRIFPPHFKGQVLALFSAGIIISPFIPSTLAKVILAAPISANIAKALGYERNSSGAAGLFMAMYFGFAVAVPVFMSASFTGYVLKGLMPLDVQPQISWVSWFCFMLPWTIVFLATSFIAMIYLYKPEKDVQLPLSYITDELAGLGPMKSQEKIALTVLLTALFMWITEDIHGIAAAIVTIVAMCVLILFKILDRTDFGTKLNWQTLIFIGCAISMVYVLQALKIDTWMGQVLGLYLNGYISEPYIFIFILSIIIYLVRFIIVSTTATMIIFVTLLIPVAQQIGMHPWIVGMIIYCSMQTWNTLYSNINMIAGLSFIDNMATYHQTAKMSAVYMAISIIGLCACVPYWRYLGYLP